ncbi:hypothetical protein DOY81_008911, partial [Sarcophaga bullata]
MFGVDGFHIEVRPSQEDATDCYNYKGWYSIVLLALVDARYRFIYVNCGSPGRCNVSQIFEGFTLKQQFDQCNLLHDLSKQISSVNVPLVIIDYSAFKFLKFLSDNLMKPYPFQLLQSHQQKCFNYQLPYPSPVDGSMLDAWVMEAAVMGGDGDEVAAIGDDGGKAIGMVEM